MKIAISSTGPDLDSAVDARMGRAAYFVIIETDTMEFTGIENSSAMAGGGAGIQSAQNLAESGVKTVLTGNCGPNAFQVFGAAGVQVITGVNGTVKEAVEKFKSGQYNATAQPSVQSHFGMGGNMGGGTGKGLGKGQRKG